MYIYFSKYSINWTKKKEELRSSFFFVQFIDGILILLSFAEQNKDLYLYLGKRKRSSASFSLP